MPGAVMPERYIVIKDGFQRGQKTYKRGDVFDPKAIHLDAAGIREHLDHNEIATESRWKEMEAASRPTAKPKAFEGASGGISEG